MQDNFDSTNRTTFLLQSSFQRPHYGDEVVARPRLFALLSEQRRLTIVSAADGYGKTVLVSTWLDTLVMAHTWLTLDASHNDPSLFAAYFLAAIRKLAPDVGRDLQALLVPTESDSAEIADYLIGEVDGIERPMIVVLDNYQSITANEVHAIVEKLIQQMPRSLRFLLITRRDPPFSLTSLRAYGLLTEIRTRALRFTQEETAAFLGQKLNVALPDKVVAHLHARTEGWVAGLHLMTLHIQGYSSVDEALRNMPALDRFATEYLATVVLRRQPLAVQNFLIKTAILDSLCVSLCAAVIGDSDSENAAGQLQTLRTNNLFISEVGNQASWYAYQHLFRRVLLDQLSERLTPQAIAALHARASAWYAREGLLDVAITHAKAAGDPQLAVDMFARRRHDLMNKEEWRTLRRLLDLFDRETVEQHADLLLAEAWLRSSEGRTVAYAPLLARIDRLIEMMEAEPLEQGSQASALRLRTDADILRSQLLLVSGQPRAAIELAKATITRIPQDWQAAGSFLIFSLAGAYQMTGDLAQALVVLRDAQASPHAYPSVFHVRTLAAQCMMHWIAADLPGLLQTTVQMSSLSDQLGLVEMRAWAAYFAGSAYFQWDELERAERSLQPVVQQRAATSSVVYANAACVLALTYQAQGRGNDALALVIAATEHLSSSSATMLPLAQVLSAEIAVRQGDFVTATQWAIRETRPAPLVPAFYCLAPRLTRARVLLALDQAGASQEALQLLQEARDYYQEIHNTRFLIETLVLLASLHSAENAEIALLDVLEQALVLAQPGGATRIFIDAGTILLEPLETLAARNVAPALVGQICAAVRSEQRTAPPRRAKATEAETRQHVDNVQGALIEPLTPRELDVLALMAKRITNREIAVVLDISANTVKQHIGNILAKLESTDRRQAIARAAQLGMLSSDDGLP